LIFKEFFIVGKVLTFSEMKHDMNKKVMEINS